MYSIIPLAGPDFYNQKYGIKPLFKMDGEFLIKKILNSRNWVKNKESVSEDFIFIIKNSIHSAEFKIFLQKEFVNCKIVEISDFSRGALMSCLAGIAMITDFNKPIVCDLVDVDFESDLSPKNEFIKDKNLGAILPYFDSDNMQYSYADIDENGYVKETKEKKGWNFNGQETAKGHASAGVYFFRNLEIFLGAARDSVINYEKYNHNGNLFLCPVINGVVGGNYRVLAREVSNINSIGLNFK